MQLSEVRGSSDQAGSGADDETRGWDSRQGLRENGHKRVSLRDKDSSNLEDLEHYTLVELEPPRSSSPGIYLAEVDSDSEIRNGQCGLARSWAPTGRATGQGRAFPSVQWGKPIASKFLGLPGRALAQTLHAFNQPNIP